MIRLLFITLLLAHSLLSWGQHTVFSQLYDIDTSADFGTDIVELDSSYAAFCTTVKQDGSRYLGILIIDKKGSVKAKKAHSYGRFSNPNVGNCIATRDGYLVDARTVQAYDTTKKKTLTWFVVSKFTAMGDMVWSRHFLDSNQHFLARNLVETPDSGFVVIGAHDHWTRVDYDPIFVRIDKNGKELYRKEFDTGGQEEVYYIIQHTDGYYYVGGHGDHKSVYHPWIMKLDTALNPIWNRHYPSGSGQAASLGSTPDGNLVFTTDTFIRKEGPRKIYTRAQLYKIDTAGNTIWQRTHGEVSESANYSRVAVLPDSSIVTLGRFEPPSGIYYHLTKHDRHGYPRWQHRYIYKAEDESNYLWNMIATSDGGFLMSGDHRLVGAHTQDIWLVKVNPKGCLAVCDSTKVFDYTSVVPVNGKTTSIRAYPNPITHQNLTLSGLPTHTPIQLLLYDGLGRKKFGQTWNPNTPKQTVVLPPALKGMYHLVLLQNHQLLHQQRLLIYD